MGRKKAKDSDTLLSKIIWTRVTEEAYQRLEGMVGHSDCHSVGEVARRILSKEKIASFIVDRSMDAPLEELIRIRKEINSIGININQITHTFHSTEGTAQKAVQALKVAEQYRKVGDKIDLLLPLIAQLSKKWLQK